MPEIRCFFCKQRKDLTITPYGTLSQKSVVNCPYCREYEITDSAIHHVSFLSTKDQLKLAAYNCHHYLKTKIRLYYYVDKGPNQSSENARNIDEILKTWWPEKIDDKMEVTLLNFYHVIGDRIGHSHLLDAPDLPFCISEDQEGFRFVLIQLLEDKLIHFDQNQGLPYRVEITRKGFNKIYELLRGLVSKESKKVFIAMSFDPSLEEIWEDAIKPAIENCGYTPLRIDKQEHNEKICDKIEAEIRKARFIVADFTHNKHGVYYEAGFARGLGLNVIWTAKEEDEKKLHFDTRQYNHIIWKTPEELKDKLEVRIKALGI